jgi:ABC-type polysaccharide/polyol phosphate export permease
VRCGSRVLSTPSSVGCGDLVDVPFLTALRDLGSSRELVVNLTLREVRGKYKRTALGQLWSLLNPLATMVIFTIVFGVLLRVEVPPGDPSGLDVFALWLMCGLIPWTFMSNAVTGGMSALVANANLVTKVYFRREVLVAANVFALDVTFAMEMLVLSAVLLIFGSMVLPWLPLVIVFMIVLSAFALGLALMLAVANVYFRDTQHFLSIFMQFWFYATPIVYPASLVPADRDVLGVPMRTLYELNPMEHFVAVFRSLLYDGRFPELGDVLYTIGAAVVALAAGWAIFQRYEPRLAEEL